MSHKKILASILLATIPTNIFAAKYSVTTGGTTTEHTVADDTTLNGLTGDLVVSSGNLKFTGTLNGKVTVNSGATLLGAGTISDNTTIKGAFGAYGTNSRINILKDLTLSSGSTLKVYVNTLEEESYIDVKGKGTINTTLDISLASGDYTNQDYDLLFITGYVNPDYRAYAPYHPDYLYQAAISDADDGYHPTDVNMLKLRILKRPPLPVIHSRLPEFSGKSNALNLADYHTYLKNTQKLNADLTLLATQAHGKTDAEKETLYSPLDPSGPIVAMRAFSLDSHLRMGSIIRTIKLQRQFSASLDAQKKAMFLGLRSSNNSPLKLVELAIPQELWGFNAAAKFNHGSSSNTHMAIPTDPLSVQGTSTSNIPPLSSWSSSKDYTSFWIEPLIQKHTQTQTTNNSTVKDNSIGIAIGADHWAWDNILIGASASFTRNRFDWKAAEAEKSAANGRAHNLSASFYTMYITDSGLVLDGTLSVGHNHYKAIRNYTLSGVGSYTAEQSHGAFTGSLEGGLAYTINVGQGLLQPFANVAYVMEKESEYKENGANGWNLIVDSHVSQLLKTETGLLIAQAYKSGSKLFMPSLKLGWIYKKPSNSASTVSAGFTDYPGRFISTTATGERNFFAPGLSFNVISQLGTEVSVNYAGEFSKNEKRHNVFLKVNFKF